MYWDPGMTMIAKCAKPAKGFQLGDVPLIGTTCTKEMQILGSEWSHFHHEHTLRISTRTVMPVIIPRILYIWDRLGLFECRLGSETARAYIIAHILL